MTFNGINNQGVEENGDQVEKGLIAIVEKTEDSKFSNFVVLRVKC